MGYITRYFRGLKLSDVDARASEEADCNSNDRDLDGFIFSGKYIFNEANNNYFRS